MIDNELNMGRRRSLRLAGYDYSSAGMYFVTVCTDGKVNLFGEIVGGKMKLNPVGEAVLSAWNEISERFAAVQLDAFVVMPNHFHGVIFIFGNGVGVGNRVAAGTNAKANSKDSVEGAASSADTNANSKDSVEGAASSAPTLGKIMRAFKSISAIRINEILGRKGQAVWQRNYFERIVRRGKDLENIRRYIAENPQRWDQDEENPERK
jgi:REP element-mobilizing transposase RayT